MQRRSRQRLPLLGLAAALLEASIGNAEPADGRSTAEKEPPEIRPGRGRIEEFLGCELRDGSQPAHVGPGDMPWRVAIGVPQSPPLRAGRRRARDVAIESMRQWEDAIRTELPWFRLEFVEKDPNAQVIIVWMPQMTGNAAGRGGPTCWVENGELRAGGRMELAVRSCPTCLPLSLDQVRKLVAHEFGHVLGLGHCLDCDSAMNDSWDTLDRIFVTGTDVEAAVRRFSAGPAEPGTAEPPSGPD